MSEENEVVEVKIPTELVKPKQVAIMQKILGLGGAILIDWHKIDYTRGRGILENNDRCLWTTDGFRITIALTSDGGVITTQGNVPDPDIPPAVYTMEEYYG